jgi:hypothetical protein
MRNIYADFSFCEFLSYFGVDYFDKFRKASVRFHGDIYSQVSDADDSKIKCNIRESWLEGLTGGNDFYHNRPRTSSGDSN